MQVMYQLPPELLDAYLDALHILLSRPVSGQQGLTLNCVPAALHIATRPCPQTAARQCHVSNQHPHPATGICAATQDGGRSFSLTACTSAQADAEAALAAIATHPGCLHLDMAWHSVDERGVILHSGERLPSLRYIRSMRVRLMDEALLELSLHMPRLEELAVPAVSDEFVAPTVPERLELSCGYNPDHLRAFPALRRLTVAAQRLELVAPASEAG